MIAFPVFVLLISVGLWTIIQKDSINTIDKGIQLRENLSRSDGDFYAIYKYKPKR